MSRPELIRRAEDYCRKKGLVLGNALGSGVHGSVFAANYQTEYGRVAIKIHERETDYCRERDVYLRFQENSITEVRGCAVPELLAYDDKLLVIEMTVVTRPFVLDFAGAYFDRPPEFSEEVLADWRAEKQEQFGKRWPEVQAILRQLEGYGVFVADVTANNISFGG